MCDQNNLKTQFVTNFKLKGLMCDQNNLKNQSVTNLKLKGPLVWFIILLFVSIVSDIWIPSLFVMD